MEKALASIAPEGWLPMAAAMLGTESKPPMWANVGLRPVVGTTIDLKVRSALSYWLVGVDVEQGPDGIDSPTFLKQNFDVLEAVQPISRSPTWSLGGAL